MLQLLAMSRAALDRGEIDQAEQLAQQAHALRVPDQEFAPGQVRPWMLLLEIDRAKRAAQTAHSPTGPVQPAYGDPRSDSSRVQPAAAEQLMPPARLAQQPFPGESLIDNAAAATPSLDIAQEVQEPIATPLAETPTAEGSLGYDLLRRGEAAVKARDFEQAQALFRDAWKYEAELDPAARQRLQDNLQLLRVTDVPTRQPRTDVDHR